MATPATTDKNGKPELCTDKRCFILLGFLLDMDDLLIQTEALSKGFWKACITLAGLLCGHPEWGEMATLEFLLQFNGTTADGRRKLCMEKFGPEFPFDDVFNARTGGFNWFKEEFGVPLMPGVLDILKWAKELGIPCAIVTASKRTEVDLVLEKLGIGGYFQAIVTGDDVTKGKPDPEGYLRAAELLGVPIENCVGFEDASKGVEAIHASGALPVMIPSLIPATKRDREIAHVLPSLPAAMGWLQGQLQHPTE